jgi:hypothetical protein
MNKQQIKILLTNILPKAILLLLIVGASISFFVLKFKGEEAKKNIEEFTENGGNQATDLVMGRYDSLQIGDLKIKYSNKYNITDKFGSEYSGRYTLMQTYPKDELTIRYSSNELLGKPYGSINESIVSLEEEIVRTLKSQIKEQPKLSDIKIIKLGLFDTHIREIVYKQKHLYIYGIVSKKHFLTFTSHKKHFLNAIIRNIEIYKKEQSKENKSITDNSTSTKIKTFKNLKIPLYEWIMDNEVKQPELEFYGMSLVKEQENIDFMTETHKNITTLVKYSEYSEERVVRQMKYKDVTLLNINNESIQFNNIPAIKKQYIFKVNQTQEKFNLITLVFKYDNWFYTITHKGNSKSKFLIAKISLKK